MKYLIVLLSISFTSVVSFAESCTLSVNERKTKTINISDWTEKTREKKVVEASSPKQCFEAALDKADDFDESEASWDSDLFDSTSHRIIHSYKHYLIVRWEYNDGYVDDSDGSVSKYSKECIKQLKLNTSSDFLGAKYRYAKFCKEKF